MNSIRIHDIHESIIDRLNIIILKTGIKDYRIGDDVFCQLISKHILNGDVVFATIFKLLILLNKEFRDFWSRETIISNLSSIRVTKLVIGDIRFKETQFEMIDTKQTSRKKHGGQKIQYYLCKRCRSRVMQSRLKPHKTKCREWISSKKPCKHCGLYDHPNFSTNSSRCKITCPLYNRCCRWCFKYFTYFEYETWHERVCGDRLLKVCKGCSKRIIVREKNTHIFNCEIFQMKCKLCHVHYFPNSPIDVIFHENNCSYLQHKFKYLVHPYRPQMI